MMAFVPKSKGLQSKGHDVGYLGGSGKRQVFEPLVDEHKRLEAKLKA